MIWRPCLAVLLLAALAACAQRQALFVVLPNEGGGVGAITVDDGKTRTTLDKPLAAEEVRNGAGAAARVEPGEVNNIFAAAFSARPALPRHFRFFYELDSDRLTAESAARYCTLSDDVKRRSVYEVIIVGHSDTLGDEPYNQRLALRRAETVRDALVNDGFNSRAISIASRGSLDPLVPTPPHTAEPQNRRIEITVR
jgi:outer membrane protein OmpA-like peptidoglycan-associated protein